MKCALCSHCSVVMVAENQATRPKLTDDYKQNLFLMADYLLEKYSNPDVKIKRYVFCRRWKSLFQYRQSINREMQKCQEYDPNDLDCDDNPIDIEQYFTEISKKKLIDSKGFKRKHNK